MRKAAIISAGMLLLATAACGQRQDSPEVRGAVANGFLGPVSYRYDPALLTAADVRIEFPPAQGRRANAVKFLPARGIEGSPDLCPGGAEACPLEAQPGLTLALLERPFERYVEALRATNTAAQITPATIDGIEGISIDGGTVDGLAVEYRLVPVASRALLVTMQRDDQSAAEEAALDDVVESLDIVD